ncbi:MAG: hypothetical protein ABSF69_27965 [Polyangiaceae bacterium]|jgi:hypothetical protein
MATKRRGNTAVTEFMAQVGRLAADHKELEQLADGRDNEVQRAIGKRFNRDDHGDCTGYAMWHKDGVTCDLLEMLKNVPLTQVRPCIGRWAKAILDLRGAR